MKISIFLRFFADCFHAEICAYAVFCLQFKYTCSWLLRFTDKTFNKQLHVHMLMFLYSWSYHFVLPLCFLLCTARVVTFCCLCVSYPVQLECHFLLSLCCLSCTARAVTFCCLCVSYPVQLECHFVLSLCCLSCTARAVTFCCLCVVCPVQLELSLSVVSVLSVLYS